MDAAREAARISRGKAPSDLKSKISPDSSEGNHAGPGSRGRDGKGRYIYMYTYYMAIMDGYFSLLWHYGWWKISKIVKMANELNMSHLFSKSSTQCWNEKIAGYQQGIVLKYIQMLHVWNIY